MDLIQTWYDDGYHFIQHFDTSLIDLYLSWRSQEYEKARTSEAITLQRFQSI